MSNMENEKHKTLIDLSWNLRLEIQRDHKALRGRENESPGPTGCSKTSLREVGQENRGHWNKGLLIMVPQDVGLGRLQNKRENGREEDVAKRTLAMKNSIMKLLNYLLQFLLWLRLYVFLCVI